MFKYLVFICLIIILLHKVNGRRRHNDDHGDNIIIGYGKGLVLSTSDHGDNIIIGADHGGCHGSDDHWDKHASAYQMPMMVHNLVHEKKKSLYYPLYVPIWSNDHLTHEFYPDLSSMFPHFLSYFGHHF